MNRIMDLLSVLAVLAYGVFIFVPKQVSRKVFIVGDVLMAFVLVSLLMEESSCPLLIASLIWLIGNYIVGSRNFAAFDCFAS